ncbi:phosphatidylinositol-3,5-bisphosphate 5-phosphatase [Allomyces arbusculus]|nr:phosphatidylinositol-3,5-bisphosphate 5-phosphatase [Allomyces arbusculus]
MRYLSNVDLYETKTRIYAVGSYGTRGHAYRILKFDRTVAPPLDPCVPSAIRSTPHDQIGLAIHDDGVLYTHAQVRQVLDMLDHGNDSVRRIARCHALLGVTRFVAGYYIVAAVQSSEVAALGPHKLFRVDEVRLIPIANPLFVKIPRRVAESNYVAAFHAMTSLQQDLYYSPTYDLTHTLQHNLLAQALRATLRRNASTASGSGEPRFAPDPAVAAPSPTSSAPPLLCPQCTRVAKRGMGSAGVTESGISNCGMFTWNAYHIEIAVKGTGVLDDATSGSSGDQSTTSSARRIVPPSPWFVPAIQGFVGQVQFSVLGRPIFVTLIARRSRKFAGARFLKRGADADGWVANEVESEQIVHDGVQLHFPDLDKAAKAAASLHRPPSGLGNGSSIWESAPATAAPAATTTSPTMGATSALPVDAPTSPLLRPQSPLAHSEDDGDEPAPVAAGHSPPMSPTLGLHKELPPLPKPGTPSGSFASRIAPQLQCAFCYGRGISPDGTVRLERLPVGFPWVPPYTSFVQHRGSIPLIWSQDNSAMTPKPPISLNIRDPFYVVASKHFNRMLEHYGAPLIVFNLIKTNERVKRESILGDDFEMCVKYLNQFLVEGGTSERIEYHHIDMSREAKTGRVIDLLEERVAKMVDEIGFFACVPEAYVQARLRNDGDMICARVQEGIIRTNCIDCLDRTNAAAFVIGKCALERQLVHLGILRTAVLDFDTDAIQQLTALYERHGDAIALQYGGSALVNTMRTYRDRNLATQSRDMIETLKRYYNNSFTDAEKQDAIDIFLGVFRDWDGFVMPNAAWEAMAERAKATGKYTEWRQALPELAEEGALAGSASDESDQWAFRNELVTLEDICKTFGQDPTDAVENGEGGKFNLKGLKKWLSARNSDSQFLRERTASMSSFFGGAATAATDPMAMADLAASAVAAVDRDDAESTITSHGHRRTKSEPVEPDYVAPVPDLPVPTDAMSPAAGRATPDMLEPFPSLSAKAAAGITDGVDGTSEKPRKVKKKLIETMVEKALSLDMSSSMERGYRRYLAETDPDKLQLEPFLPIFDGNHRVVLVPHGSNLHEYPNPYAAHPDFDVFTRTCALARGDARADVSREDATLYEAYVALPGKVGIMVADATDPRAGGDPADVSWQTRVATYETWLATGRLKTAGKKAARG